MSRIFKMAPGKKQKKLKKKGSKDGPSGLSHIASQLIPSAIFAAVPRTPTNLSQTWPLRTPSPIAQAIGEAGNIGRILTGDLSDRPATEVPRSQDGEEREDGRNERNTTERDLEFEEPGYESVHNKNNYDKRTRFSRMSGSEGEEETGASGEQNFYHVLDHESGRIVEPVVYARVDKKKKIAPEQPDHEERDEKGPVSDTRFCFCCCLQNAGSSPRGPTVSEADVQMQRELVRQQQEFLHQQQEQLAKSQNQQALALKQQEQLCEQIRQLEEQQKQLQSSVSLLSPAGEDLAEIKQQEQQIVNLLSEQQRQDNELQRLHLLQQQRLEEQSNSFTHERKVCRVHDQNL
ncbi:PREDICTED: zinc finger protein 853-like [Acropora digitifera]|uniref:zinc finger protein 853-like n=1 Tax=Acropora digitifera TaxID=70779 RepID=UPI00077AC9D4|nr:PREDICTED: zinc finger protein 853-like [Acropora digitifera]